MTDAKQAADAASRTKSRFLANMSHELRTPLNGVLGMAGVLLRTPLNDAQQRYCHAIVKSGQALDGLVTDILDYTRIEAARLLIETVEFEPARVIEEVLDSVRPAATAAACASDATSTVACHARCSGTASGFGRACSTS